LVRGLEERHGLKQYPRTYSVDARTRRALDAVAIAPLGLIIGVGLLDLVGLVNKRLTPSTLLAIGFLAGLYALLISRSTHRRVILYEDGIEVLTWFSVRKLKCSEMLGRRMGKLAWQAGSFYIIVPSDRAARELKLPPFLHVDKDFFAWMEGIPRLKNEGRSANSP
jgi:hypothetical protein